MISFLKRLWRDPRGNALIIAGAALPLMVGSAGLASDTIQWTLWKRQLQRAADSAAVAGVYAKFNDETVSSTVDTDLARNNHTYAALTGAPQLAYPANSATYINAVQVTLSVQKTLGFSSMFLSAAPTITASATAAGVHSDPFCAVGLSNSPTVPVISIGGSSNTNLGCGAISNGTSPTQSVGTNGNAYNFVADPVAGVGGLPSAITGVTELQPRHLPMPDPFAGKYSTDIPGGTGSCTNFNSKITDTSTTGTGTNRVTTYTMAPGCYNAFNTGPNNYVLAPGVYYLNNVDFVANGGTTITGTGVTIILTGTDPGSVQINGNATLQLTAPTDPNNAYAKMLFIQAANADVDNTNVINGTAASAFDGAFYFPKGEVQFTGTNASTTKCAMVVGYRLTFTGNTALQNDTVGCVADQTVTSYKIRLIA